MGFCAHFHSNMMEKEEQIGGKLRLARIEQEFEE